MTRCLICPITKPFLYSLFSLGCSAGRYGAKSVMPYKTINYLGYSFYNLILALYLSKSKEFGLNCKGYLRLTDLLKPLKQRPVCVRAERRAC